MLVVSTLELERVNLVDNVAQIGTAIDFVTKLGEYLANLVLDGAGIGGGILELAKMREEFLVDEIHQFVSRHGVDRVQLARRGLGGSPTTPTVVACEYGAISLALELCLHVEKLFEVVEVFEEKEPGGLLDIVQFATASCLVPQDLVYGLEC